MCNPEQTEIMHMTYRYNRRLSLQANVSLADTTIEMSDKIRNLGVILDMNMTLSNHEICKNATLAIRLIGRIGKYLSKNSLQRLVNALVISRLDYANSILYGVPKNDMDKLQRIQNTAARLIAGIKKFDHITHVLKELHWLPIESRINFNILALAGIQITP